MFLVVDANIMFSFFASGSWRRQLLEKLPNRGYKLFCPMFALDELSNNRKRICRFAHIDDLQFSFLFSLLVKRVEYVPKAEYEGFVSEAEKLAPHTKDAVYFALALAYNCPIWSDEVAFKSQSDIEVFSTRDMLEKLGIREA